MASYAAQWQSVMRPAPESEGQLPAPGEIRIIGGKRCRFIERELEGDKWEVLEP